MKPLSDLGKGMYHGYRGGLYGNGKNSAPKTYVKSGLARARSVKPVNGKIVLLSIGMSNTTQEWCSASGAPPCTSWSLMGRAATDMAVNHTSLVIVNGAQDGQDVTTWTSPTSANYERIRTARLNPLGLSENQVQAAWVKLSAARPVAGLPSDTADAHTFLTGLGQVVRTLKIRYPNLQLVFLSSRTYGGYATIDLSPEPFAYQEGFAVKWAIVSQMNEVRGTGSNPRAGTLDYIKRAAPILVWGPYLWADGATPRSDGLRWLRADFEEDGIQPSQTGETKVATILLEFFKNSTYTRCWFVANQYCLL